LDGEGVILVGDQQDGGKKRQISTPVSAFSAIVGVSLKVDFLKINMKTLIFFYKNQHENVKIRLHVDFL
jgi:hypothetical protein